MYDLKCLGLLQGQPNTPLVPWQFRNDLPLEPVCYCFLHLEQSFLNPTVSNEVITTLMLACPCFPLCYRRVVSSFLVRGVIYQHYEDRYALNGQRSSVLKSWCSYALVSNQPTWLKGVRRVVSPELALGNLYFLFRKPLALLSISFLLPYKSSG